MSFGKAVVKCERDLMAIKLSHVILDDYLLYDDEEKNKRATAWAFNASCKSLGYVNKMSFFGKHLNVNSP